MLVDALVILVIALACLFWLTAARLDYARYALEEADKDLNHTLDALEQTNAVVSDLAVKFTPLLEQTDWMTGRWGGQFNTLVAMEKQRNAAIVSARAALFNVPIMQEATREALPEFATVIKAHEDRA